VAWQGEPLPRGRHKLDLAEVRASQRARIARAMLEVVAEHGYEATTVAQVVAAARVSRNAFYEFFTDKSDCFLTLTDELATELLEAVIEANLAPSWIEALRRGSDIYLAWWRDHEFFARAYFSGLAELGPRALAQRQATYSRFEAMFRELGRRARAEQPDLPPLPEIVPRVLVYAITELIADEVRAGRAAQLDGLRDEVFVLIVRLLADDATARAVAS
jgi:AcrR family transcriptional regulator